MAGIYLHVPFCKVKCHYCDFHFSVQLQNRGKLIDAMIQELNERKHFLQNQTVNTIYFGGGTPSVVESDLVGKMIHSMLELYQLDSAAEITIECNPDDLTPQKLKDYKSLGINRLSIGTQSFDDKVLKFMNRAHNAQQASGAIKMAQDAGFDNLTIDLIYGVPGSSLSSWEKELEQMERLLVPHLSAYCLTIEENTVFGNWQKTGKIKPFSDEESLKQFELLIERTAELKMEHYEISNFAKEGYISKHNSAYWLGEHYLGIGPSAHSYNGTERGWNSANNARYQLAIQKNTAYYEYEKLSVQDRFNDYILTRLRTKWGIVLTDLEAISPLMLAAMQVALKKYVAEGFLLVNQQTISLSSTGRFIADGISADLFYIAEE